MACFFVTLFRRCVLFYCGVSPLLFFGGCWWSSVRVAIVCDCAFSFVSRLDCDVVVFACVSCVCLSVSPSVRPSVHPSGRPSVCLSARLSVCLHVLFTAWFSGKLANLPCVATQHRWLCDPNSATAGDLQMRLKGYIVENYPTSYQHMMDTTTR